MMIFIILLLPYLIQSIKTKPVSTNLASKVVSAIMNSPLYGPIVGAARDTMVKTAIKSGIDWQGYANKMEAAANWTDEVNKVLSEGSNVITEDYYKEKFHGYEQGNLCMKAAIEQEIAGKAVGARNFPNDGVRGEEILRRCFDNEIINLGGDLNHILKSNNGLGTSSPVLIVDMGCGTGTSTRRLANLFPQPQVQLLGIELSPYMVAIGRFLQREPVDWWVETITPDPRIRYQYGNIANTGLEDASADLVNFSLVLHELPQEATMRILTEAHRILKPGGTLIISEMDPESPGYLKLRANTMLFSVLRSTEPYLDEYFDLAPTLPTILADLGFPTAKLSAATGRHFCLVATKAGYVDCRPSAKDRLLSDQHVASPFKGIKGSGK